MIIPRAIRLQTILRTIAAGGFALAMLIHGVLPVLAQSSPVELDMEVAPETIYVGDWFTITLSATYPRDHFTIFPQVEPNWGEFEVRSQTSAPTVDNGDGTLTSSIQIEAALFSTGEIPTPELSVAIRKPDGEIINRPVSPIYISVSSILPDNNQELKDLKPQAELPVPLDPLSFLEDRDNVVIATLAGGIAIAALAIYLWGRMQSPMRPEPGTPAEVALRELDRIASLGLDSDDDFKERYTMVSDCLRVYLWNRFGIPAPELTTLQTQGSLESVEMEASDANDLSRILNECDLVKFARFIPDEDDANRVIEQARGFVRSTGADSTAEQESAAGAGAS